MTIVGNSTSRLSLILHEERNQFSIGESVTVKMEVINYSDQNVEVPGFQFDWDELVFRTPNDVRLIGPRGDDLMGAYRQSGSDALAGISVQANNSEWLYLPISTYMETLVPGDYRFQVTLTADGESYQSNVFAFSLKDVPTNAAKNEVELEIARSEPDELAELYLNTTFLNRSNRAITFLKPQEDSFSGWANPVYRFKVIDKNDRVIQQARRSGTMAEPVYDAQSMVTLLPGERLEQRLRLENFPLLAGSGTYRISLEYIVREDAIGKGGQILDRKMNWDPDVFLGRLVSNEVVITVT